MKYNVLLNSSNQSFFKDFLTNVTDDFFCISTSNYWADIKGHCKVFMPDAFVCVIEEDEAYYKSILKNLRESLSFSKIPTVVITTEEISQNFSIADMDNIDLILYRPITVGKVYSQIKSHLDAKRYEEEKRQEEERLRQEELAKLEEEAKQAEDANEKKNILVIDDDKNVLKLLKLALEEKYTVTTMITGKMAEKYLEMKSCDLILLDYMMPGETGPEVFAKIKQIESAKDIPIVFLTGIADKEKIAEVLQLKPQGYLLKPINIAKLKETIERVIGQQQ